MATRQAIDGYLGTGYFQAWKDMQQETREVLARIEQLQDRIDKMNPKPETTWLWVDSSNLDDVSQDYALAMEAIGKGKAPNIDRVNVVHDVYSVALQAARTAEGYYRAVFDFHFGIGFMMAPLLVMAAQAERLRVAIKKLIPLLEEAKSQRNEAWAKAVLNQALTVAQMMIPGLGIAGRLAIIGGQMVLEHTIGVEGGSTAASVAEDGNNVIGAAADSVTDLKKLSEKKKSIARTGKKASVVVGIAFDVKEVAQGIRNVDELEKALATARRELDKLLSYFRRVKPEFSRLQIQYARVMDNLKQSKKVVDQDRQVRDDVIRETRYNIGTPTSW